MEIFRVALEEAEQARGIVIVIDVIRAFSVAGYAFAGGAQGIWMVRTIEEAQQLRERDPEAWLIGEVKGRLIPGFQLNNSPSLMAQAAVRGRQLIQRTGAGTQGAVGASNASHLLLSALTNASATAKYAERLSQQTGDPITLLPTFTRADTPWLEDEICADYIQALLTKQEHPSAIITKGREHLEASGRFNMWRQQDADFPSADIDAVFAADRFDFAIVGEHKVWQDISYVDAQWIAEHSHDHNTRK